MCGCFWKTQLINLIRCLLSNNSGIIIDGTKLDENVSVYNTSGVLVYSTKSLGEKIIIPLNHKAIYIVKTESETVKVVL